MAQALLLFFSILPAKFLRHQIFFCFNLKTIIKVSNENVNKRLEWAQSKAADIIFFIPLLCFPIFSSPLWRLAASVRSFQNVYIFERYHRKREIEREEKNSSSVCIYMYTFYKLQWMSAVQKKHRPRIPCLRSTWKDGKHTVTNYYKLSFELPAIVYSRGRLMCVCVCECVYYVCSRTFSFGPHRMCTNHGESGYSALIFPNEIRNVISSVGCWLYVIIINRKCRCS